MKVHESDSEHFRPITLTLDLANQEQFQLIYPSQLYGTFFTVSAKLTISEDKKSVTKIELSLVNYKGLYNIGLLPSTKDNWGLKEGTGIIVLDLQAYNGINNQNLLRELEITLPNEILLKDFRRIFTTRSLISFRNEEEVKNHLLEGTFDNEFFVRNGKYIAAIQRLDNELPNDPPTDINLFAGDSCMQTTTKIVSSS